MNQKLDKSHLAFCLSIMKTEDSYKNLETFQFQASDPNGDSEKDM